MQADGHECPGSQEPGMFIWQKGARAELLGAHVQMPVPTEVTTGRAGTAMGCLISQGVSQQR